MAMAVGGWGLPLQVLHVPGFSCLNPQNGTLRFLVAWMISLYHLVESSVTCRHGEYPLLYNAWAMCLPCQYAHAVSWGIAIHFVFCTGMAKLRVGGVLPWMAPQTMKFYLTAYHDSRSPLSRPFWPKWNRWACQRDWATRFMATATILLECILVPWTLFLSEPWQRYYVGCLGMMFMHIGIFGIMSQQVGIVFATTLPTYIIGFQSPAGIGTTPWLWAVVVALTPTLHPWLGGQQQQPYDMLPENWPSSPISLFMWSGDQAKWLAETLMTGQTRVVLGTADKTASNIVGRFVIHHGAVAPLRDNTTAATNSSSSTTSKSASITSTLKDTQQQGDPAVHDCVLRVIGFTILQDGLIQGIPKVGYDGKMYWDIEQFLKLLQHFLESKRRLFETQSGQPLVKAFFVRIDSQGKVAKVLHC